MNNRLRSVLYVPGLNTKAMQKGIGLPVDAIVFDLEDSISETQKGQARQTLRSFLKNHEGGTGKAHTTRVIRVNDMDTEFWRDDIDLVRHARPDAILLPKVTSASTIREANRLLNSDAAQSPIRIWIMIESALGILKLERIVEESLEQNLACLVLGTNDLAKDTDIDPGEDRKNFVPWFAHIVMVAKSYGLPVIDGVLNDIHDQETLSKECQAAKSLGMSGKTIIHPNQREAVNTLFSPTPAQLAWWEKIVAAYDMPENVDKGVIKVEGVMVERLHLETAQEKLAQFAEASLGKNAGTGS